MSKVPVKGQPAITFAEMCDRGKVREENQDSVLRAEIPLGTLLIVADGIGGYQGGAVASKMVIESFSGHLATLPADFPADRAIAEAAALSNANVIAAATAPDSLYQHMGSTIVMALLQQDPAGHRAWVGHIGDSRAYLFREGQLHKITNDHSAVQALLNRNLITPEQALNHPDASVLTRSLGHQPQVEIDIEMVQLLPGDSLMLCSDGLWGYVQEQEIHRVMADPALAVEATAKALLDLALAAGGLDNIGIELARVADPKAIVEPVKPPRRRGFMGILAVGLLVFAALGTLISFGLRHQWLHFFQHPH
jgi:serine/threonine protein phosphatase PrpC